jgi:hypothetical protein
MLERAHRVQQAIRLFIAAANVLFGPITVLRCDGRVFKKIPWSAFRISEMDWVRVLNAKSILEDSNHIQQYFSSEHKPTLWHALPAIEELQTAWEVKHDNPQYAIYKDAINDGLAKLNKYYSRFDEKPSYVLALILHPYYKLSYIAHAWGGEEEEDAEILAGNIYAKNWQAEVRKILENMVCVCNTLNRATTNLKQMARYWETRPARPTTTQLEPDSPTVSRPSLTGFDRHHRTLVASGEEGWVAELGHYLGDLPRDVTPDTDIVEYWQDNHRIYPTLGRMALDFLPCQASSVPCERLFSASKQVASDQRARLGAQKFEEIQLMKFAWRQDVVDIAAWNSSEVEQVDVEEYKDLLAADIEQAGQDNLGVLDS